MPTPTISPPNSTPPTSFGFGPRPSFSAYARTSRRRGAPVADVRWRRRERDIASPPETTRFATEDAGRGGGARGPAPPGGGGAPPPGGGGGGAAPPRPPPPAAGRRLPRRAKLRWRTSMRRDDAARRCADDVCRTPRKTVATCTSGVRGRHKNDLLTHVSSVERFRRCTRRVAPYHTSRHLTAQIQCLSRRCARHVSASTRRRRRPPAARRAGVI